ncbi:pentapeptide repeat-containing protein [Pelatocladus sp. BLCC-F211]|uniref:pentapeptide repeat-containing protein n=1 Tax=Pelatocladus sp. BLCC-F211 TaxID=3342752 RepID=UPI0035B83E82
MPLNFSGQNLRGRSFKGQNLEGANFSYADIRGADFCKAKLTGAKFSKAKAGLQKRWAICLILCSYLLLLLTGFCASVGGNVVAHIFETKNPAFSCFGAICLVSTVLFFASTVRQGLEAGIEAIVVIIGIGGGIAVFTAVTVSVATSIGFTFSIPSIWSGVVFAFVPGVFASVIVAVGTVVGSVAVATARVVGGFVAVAVGVVVTVATSISFLRFGITTLGGSVIQSVATAVTVARIVAVVITLLAAHIGWCALAGDDKNALIREVAIFFAAASGTSFRSADLTDADFTGASLKSTDFRRTTLIRTRWHQATMLNYACLGETYLKDAQIRQLVITGRGQNKIFDYRDFRGLNLSGANLAGASFIGTNFYQACLREADLTGSLLVRTQFESADLTGTTLTGTCIEDWVVTRTTKLRNVKCKYVFMKLSEDGDKRDQMPPKGEFKNDDFVLFVQSVLDTIHLYHERDVNPKLALYVLQNLSEDYQCTLEIAKIEKRGESEAIIEVKIPGVFNQEKIKETYYEKYNQYLKFYMSDPKNELKSPTSIENVTVYKGVLIGGSVSNSTVANTIDNQGDSMTGDYINQSGNFGVGVNKGEINTEKLAGTINEANEQNFVEAAAEIQQLLKQLEETNPTTTETEKMIVVAKAADEIKNNPTLKARVIGALKSGGKEAFKEAVDNPLINVLIAIIEGWQEAK